MYMYINKCKCILLLWKAHMSSTGLNKTYKKTSSIKSSRKEKEKVKINARP